MAQNAPKETWMITRKKGSDRTRRHHRKPIGSEEHAPLVPYFHCHWESPKWDDDHHHWSDQSVVNESSRPRECVMSRQREKEEMTHKRATKCTRMHFHVQVSSLFCTKVILEMSQKEKTRRDDHTFQVSVCRLKLKFVPSRGELVQRNNDTPRLMTGSHSQWHY
jgi:hypothetical protein